jgi:hypothetical protein
MTKPLVMICLCIIIIVIQFIRLFFVDNVYSFVLGCLIIALQSWLAYHFYRIYKGN